MSVRTIDPKSPINIPNLITLARLGAVPLAVWLIAVGDFRSAFWLFVAAGVSDAADGFIARWFHSRTEIGALLDPIADKALLVCVYLMLGKVGVLPMWLPVLVVARDAMIVGGFLVAQMIGTAVEWQPLWISKVNTTAQLALAALVLARVGLGLDELAPGIHALSLLLVYVVAGTTLLSGVAYVLRWARQVSRVQGVP